MKVRLVAITIFAILQAAVPLPAAGGPEGTSWVFVGFTKYRDAVYLDESRLVRKSAESVAAVCRIAPSQKSRYFKQVLAELRKAKKSSTGFRYVEILSEVGCRENALRFLGVTYFSIHGEILHAKQEPAAPWTPVQPGSLWDALRKNACGRKPF